MFIDRGLHQEVSVNYGIDYNNLERFSLFNEESL
jgi:hypothetical protein